MNSSDISFDKKREKIKNSLKKMPIIRSDKAEIMRAKKQAEELKRRTIQRKKSANYSSKEL